MQQELRQIDQEIIQLLGKRIAALSESSTFVETTLPNYKVILQQAGVPNFIWQNIVVGCTAALARKKANIKQTKPRRVTVIGGRGAMGRFFSQQLLNAGHDVNILDHDDWHKAECLLSQVDLVLICVPIDCTLEVIKKASKYLSPTTALADITSIKSPIMSAMLSHHSGAVIGLHPMFAPGVKSLLSQKIVVCSGRMQPRFQWFLDLMEDEGGKLVFSTPEEHDKIMVIVQAIRHFATLSLGSFLSEERINIDRSLDFSTPVYRQEIGIISRLIAQSATMIVDIILATPERRKAIARFANTNNRLAQLVIQGDRDSLISELQGVQSFFKQATTDSFEESNYVIDALTALLTANEVKQASDKKVGIKSYQLQNSSVG
ncbi:bifunctional chorismate mutase/prephenate dehydrogenase [Rivularia sp. UHCC 0363]|uniref:bifunctional chorismate mutase/prephenate dehydrogenase n=1 Tax=Rivularia sp. UHCC 0363 TaxID=3110244 RepID=UPI002B1F8469|nr:bifunctional chorismate mutase/prephenate dehydrogenase [Rivularia sp. UHCC 0363]MEA5595875.1 bifunctional chorismate mutase/prephenate dehydrogenase [Rivularia sp. UHCC 0363]